MNQKQTCQKLHFLEWPFEGDNKSESVPIDVHVKIPNFRAEINTGQLQVGFEKLFWSL